MIRTKNDPNQSSYVRWDIFSNFEGITQSELSVSKTGYLQFEMLYEITVEWLPIRETIKH